MISIWTFERGHLVATDPAGEQLGRWEAVPELGRPLASLLNAAQGLASLLLPHRD